MSFGLDQVYVPLTVEERKPSKKAPHDPDQDQLERLPFDETFDAWIGNNAPRNDLVRLVTGGPGSGKSSLLKALAHRWEAQREDAGDWHTIFVPLHKRDNFRFDEQNLEQSIRNYLQTEGMRGEYDPFASGETRPLLLLFDGLDELAYPESGQSISQSRAMVKAVLLAVNKLAGQERQVRAIVSGRTAVMQSVVTEDRAASIGREQLYTVQPYDEDQRKAAKQRYADALGMAADDLPVILDDEAYEDLAKEPLLHTFIALSHGRLKDLEAQGIDPNRAHIYEALFGSVFDRDVEGKKPGWQVFWQQNDTKALREDRFFKVMEALSLAAYRDGDHRTASHKAVKQAFADEELEELLADLGDSAVASLAATFFARLGQGGGIEFHHKSLGEFLYVRRLSRWAEDFAKKIEAASTDRQRVAKKDEEAFEAWLPLADANRMTLDVLDFLKDELVRRCGSSETGACWHATLWPVLERALTEGWQIRDDKVNHREAERRNVVAEEALFCTWRWLWFDREQIEGGQPQRWRFPLLDQDKRALARLRARQFQFFFAQFHDGADSASPFARSLSHCDLSQARCGNLDWHQTDFFGVNLENADLRSANLQFANLQSANLKNAQLGNADLTDANLTSADLQNANLSHTRLRAALKFADLRGTSLIGADIRGVALEGARLDGADLSHAQFTWHPKKLGAVWDEALPPQNLDKIIIDDS